jgi:hypothetical protein
MSPDTSNDCKHQPTSRSESTTYVVLDALRARKLLDHIPVDQLGTFAQHLNKDIGRALEHWDAYHPASQSFRAPHWFVKALRRIQRARRR